jgi:hypothetical protein
MSTDSGGTQDPLAPGGPDDGPDPLKREFPDPAPKPEQSGDDERPPLGFPDPDDDGEHGGEAGAEDGSPAEHADSDRGAATDVQTDEPTA